ncbi:hypothetical protein K2173_018154 [Erythroxylum novogranatense]|uniref:GIL1/IRKI C-terminal domain-containing protein n=1 Tax=Erythroxylum novogranatense TaxID=1862640 RepID=A0AAV8TME9_9ROSI|nr:hypothetical protein K2173_018154 [Erythroxylum novogranatense]
MAPSSKSSSFSPHPHQPRQFTPIQECEREDQEDGCSEERISPIKATPVGCKETRTTPTNHRTPFHDKYTKPVNSKRRQWIGQKCGGNDSVSCNKCRPHAREKISVVPLDNNGLNRLSSSIPSPNAIFKSFFSSLVRKSPKSSDVLTVRDEQWKHAVVELSHKLTETTRTRDEALLEASRLKDSMTELEKKLNKLEVYCHNLKSGLEKCSGNSPYQTGKGHSVISREPNIAGFNDKAIEQFLVLVSEARSSVRLLSRALATQLKHLGCRVFERLSMLLRPYDINISISKNSKTVPFYLEALLSKTFFEDFESVGFQKGSINQVLNPIARCEANYASFNVLKELKWEDVLNKGTRHFSEEFSKFCDRKMNEIVAMLGWNRAWAEPLLQAFFCASKSVWLVHLLANSVHPCLTIFRVDKGVSFDTIYMEDVGGDRARNLVPTMVRIMVAPGFYVYDNVVKCKVVCRYRSNGISNYKGLTPSP